MFSARRFLKYTGFLLVLLVGLMCGIGALAATDPVDFTIEINPTSLTAPGKVSVSLRVTNTGSTDMPYPVTLYDPAGKAVPTFGDGGSQYLKADSFKSWTGDWTVTQEQLDAGEFTYTLKYDLDGDDGSIVQSQKLATAKIAFTGERVELSVTRTADPQVARSGGTVTVVYELYNAGNVKLTDIKIQEKIAKTAQTEASLNPGEKKTFTFTAKMGSADLTSSATITYKAAGSTATKTQTVDALVIPLAKPNLSMSLSASDTAVDIGSAVTLTVTFTNEGNISYTATSVKDAKWGEMFTNIEIPAGQTVSKSKEYTLLERTTFKLTAALKDNTGSTNTMDTGEVTVGAYDPEKTLRLSLNLSCDTNTIPKTPYDLRFVLVVTNNSNVKAENIRITHGNVSIYTIASMEPGASVELPRDVTISEAGKYQFTAKAKDALGNEMEFFSNDLRITIAAPTQAPTSAPTATVPVLVTIAPPTTKDVDDMLGRGVDSLTVLAIALGIIFAGMFILFAVSSFVRLNSKRKSSSAYDHFERAARRDYTEPADDELDVEAKRTEFDKDELPHERLIADEEENAPAIPDPLPLEAEKPAMDGMGGYRMTRTAQDEQPAPAQESAEEEPEEATEEAAPRRRRAAQRHTKDKKEAE